MAKRDSLSEWDRWVQASLRGMIRYKWSKLKSDPRTLILLFVELVLAIGIGVSIALYLDPEWNVVPFPWNILVFLLLAGMAFLIHRKTRPYRVARRIAKMKEQ